MHNNNKPITHGELITILKECNIKVGRGCCNWFASTSINAFYNNGMETFAKRIQFMHATKDLSQKIQQAKAHITQQSTTQSSDQKQDKSFDNDRVLIDVLAFLESELLFMFPEQYTELTEDNTVVRQRDSECFVSLIAGDKLLQAQGLVKVKHYSGFYYHTPHQSELTNYLNLLKAHIIVALSNNNPYQLPGIAFRLSSINHAISICYDWSKQCWFINDINQIHLLNKPITNEMEMATHIFNAFEFNKGHSTIFTTNVTAPTIALHDVAKIIHHLQQSSEYKNIHAVTDDKATNLTEKFKSQWLFVSAQNGGELDTIMALIKKGADLQYKYDSFKPFDVACAAADKEVLSYLYNKYIESDMKTIHGLIHSPIQINLRNKCLSMLLDKLISIYHDQTLTPYKKYYEAHAYAFKMTYLDNYLLNLHENTVIDYTILIDTAYQQVIRMLADSTVNGEKAHDQYTDLIFWITDQAKALKDQYKQTLSNTWFSFLGNLHPTHKQLNKLSQVLQDHSPKQYEIQNQYKPY